MSATICEHIKENGARCGSPAKHKRTFCYFHWRLYRHNLPVDAPEYQVPALDSERGIQLAVAHVIRGIYSGKLDNDTARVALAAIRLAAQSLRVHEELCPDCLSTETTPAMETHFAPLEQALGGPPSLSIGNAGIQENHSSTELPEHLGPASEAQSLPSFNNAATRANHDNTINRIHPARSRFQHLEPARQLAYARAVLRRGPADPEFQECARFLDTRISTA